MTTTLRCLLFPGDTTLQLDSLPSSTTLLELRSALISRLPLSEGARIPTARIIFSGRQFTSEQANLTLGQLGIPPGLSSLHIVMSGTGSAGSGGSASPAAAAAGDVETGDAARGFDRLLQFGLDGEGIAVLRSLFLPEVLSTMGPLMPREEGETEQNRVFRMEEAWMAQQSEGSDFAHNIRPFLRRNAGAAPAPAFMLPRAAAPWMLHPYVQQTMQQARAAGLSEQDVLRAGYTAAARVGIDPTAGPGGAQEDEEGGGAMTVGDARSNLGAILCGVFVGTFLGWIAVFFLLNGNSNRWFKSGITLGIFVNLVVLILYPPSQDTPSSSTPSSGGGSGSRSGGGSGWDNPSDSPWAHAVGGGPAPLSPPSG